MDFLQTCESVFNEIQRLRKDVLAGKISPENYALQMAGIALMEKQQKLIIASMVVEYKTKKVIPVSLDGSSNPETDKVECPDQGKLITLADCLDYSGVNTENCQSCENFKRSRRLLLTQTQ